MFRDSHGAENVYFHDPDGTYPVWLEKIEATGLYVQLSNLVHELTLAKRGWIHGSRDHQGLPWVLCILVRNICLCMQYNIKINFLHFGPPRYSPSVVSLRAYVAYKMHISVSAWHVSKCVSYATLMSQSQGADGIRHQSDKGAAETLDESSLLGFLTVWIILDWCEVRSCGLHSCGMLWVLCVALNVHLSDCLWCGATCRRVCIIAYRSTGASICWSYLEHTLIRYALYALSRCFTMFHVAPDLREVKIGHRCRSNWWLWPPYWPGSGRENLALKEVFIWFNYNFVNV